MRVSCCIAENGRRWRPIMGALTQAATDDYQKAISSCSLGNVVRERKKVEFRWLKGCTRRDSPLPMKLGTMECPMYFPTDTSAPLIIPILRHRQLIIGRRRY